VFGLEETSATTVFTLFALFLFALIAVKYVIHRQEEDVARCLRLAEQDFNNLISSGTGHGGRKERVAERRDWNETAAPGATILVNPAGYRSPAHDLIQWNENDANGKGTTMGKASITAFLLRELYRGDVEAAQIKIAADRRNSGALPYLAPGMHELLGLNKFDEKTLTFPEDAGVPRWLLRRVVRKWGFPLDIRMLTTDAATGEQKFRSPHEALDSLLQQNL
jgi:hypothetical protein